MCSHISKWHPNRQEYQTNLTQSFYLSLLLSIPYMDTMLQTILQKKLKDFGCLYYPRNENAGELCQLKYSMMHSMADIIILLEQSFLLFTIWGSFFFRGLSITTSAASVRQWSNVFSFCYRLGNNFLFLWAPWKNTWTKAEAITRGFCNPCEWSNRFDLVDPPLKFLVGLLLLLRTVIAMLPPESLTMCIKFRRHCFSSCEMEEYAWRTEGKGFIRRICPRIAL